MSHIILYGNHNSMYTPSLGTSTLVGPGVQTNLVFEIALTHMSRQGQATCCRHSVASSSEISFSAFWFLRADGFRVKAGCHLTKTCCQVGAG